MIFKCIELVGNECKLDYKDDEKNIQTKYDQHWNNVKEKENRDTLSYNVH